jgi:hypothetical protein
MDRDKYRLTAHTYIQDGTRTTLSAPWPDARPLPAIGDTVYMAVTPDAAELHRCEVLSVERFFIPPEPVKPTGNRLHDIVLGEPGWVYQAVIHLRSSQPREDIPSSGNVVRFPETR